MVTLSFLFVLSWSAGRAADKSTFRLAPLNPKYLKFKAERAAAKLTGTPLAKNVRGGHTFGHIPPPVDFSYLGKDSARYAAGLKLSYPSSFDLRNVKGVCKVPPVKNQSWCGSCWAHGAMASVETVLTNGKIAAFSEQAIMDMAGFDLGPCDGGWDTMAVAVMARQGIVAQKQYPYQYLAAPDTVPTTPASAWSGVHIQNVDLLTISPNSDGTPYTSDAKWAVTTYLASVAVSFYADDGMSNSTTSADYNTSTCAYYDPSGDSANHTVAIIGWNDQYPASNFSTKPPGNGAYLIRNSWGQDWGNSGYFWLSYYDTSLAWDIYSYYGVEPTTNYNWTYQYDSLGWTGMGGWDDGDYGYKSNTAWMANVFRANSQGSLIKAVAFYVPDAGTSYTVKIYDNVTDTGWDTLNMDPVSGTLKATATGTLDRAGYHTVKLAKPVHVTTAALFSVVVGLNDPHSNGYPIAVQQPDEGYTPNMWVMPCQSFASPDGASGNWTDLASVDSTTNSGYNGYKVCVKAFGVPD
jgi:C1A family cysteine protease